MASDEDMSVSVEDGVSADGREVSARLTTDAVIPVTIAVLAAAFSATLFVLVLVCRRRHRCRTRLELSDNRYVATGSSMLHRNMTCGRMWVHWPPLAIFILLNCILPFMVNKRCA